MNEKYKRIHDLLSTIKVLCTFIATFYIVYWFLLIANIPYIEQITFVFGAPIKLIEEFYKWQITYDSKQIGMTPVIVAAVFQAFHFVFQFVCYIIENIDKKETLKLIEQRKMEEKLINKDLKAMFHKKTLRYTKFAILLSFDLKANVNPEFMDKSLNYEDLAMKQYVRIVTAMREKYPTCKAITPDKLFIMYDNFSLFDDFFTDIIKELKMIANENVESKITTNFVFSIEAMDENAKIADVLDLLEKIAALNYPNKAIATSSFSIRYNLNEKKKYYLDTMGISRLDKKKNGTIEAEDIELFVLKTTKHQPKPSLVEEE